MSKLTDEQIEQVMADKFGVDLYIEDMVITNDTIADFKAAMENYADKGKVLLDSANNLIVDGVRASKGQPKRVLNVVDLGDIRVVTEEMGKAV